MTKTQYFPAKKLDLLESVLKKPVISDIYLMFAEVQSDDHVVLAGDDRAGDIGLARVLVVPASKV